MLLCYNCDLSLRALAVSFDAWIVHSGDSNHTKWHASSESVDLLEFFKWLSKHNLQVIHYYMNFLIRTPAGSLITAWEKNAPEPGHKPARLFSCCKHVLIIKLMMPTASYKLEDSPSKNPPERREEGELSVLSSVCLFLCICRFFKDLRVNFFLGSIKVWHAKMAKLDNFWW